MSCRVASILFINMMITQTMVQVATAQQVDGPTVSSRLSLLQFGQLTFPFVCFGFFFSNLRFPRGTFNGTRNSKCFEFLTSRIHEFSVCLRFSETGLCSKRLSNSCLILFLFFFLDFLLLIFQRWNNNSRCPFIH